MKKFTNATAIIAAMFLCTNFYGQTLNSGFDDLSLDSNSYWIGSSYGSNDFTSGFAHFSQFFDTTYYTWNGFAYSNVIDTITSSWINQYACRAGIGAENTNNYGVFYQWGNDSVWFDSLTQISGLYVTNSTYAALTMQNGDAFSKKFGGETGNDPDWFLLSIYAFDNESNIIDTVEYYLADYRFDDNASDYILADWQFVDLSSLGKIKTLKFSLSSSDNGDWGMNTPAYFCLDEIKAANSLNLISFNKSELDLNIYPNPFVNYVNVNFQVLPVDGAHIQIFNITGQLILKQIFWNYSNVIDLRELNNGIYFINISTAKNTITYKIIKE
ncbi:MAG: DUF4465 domain-containing protein [Chlorobi bacterium]|nr:DUF4465 domain-containing protein [Chlorobiota bacterium]